MEMSVIILLSCFASIAFILFFIVMRMGFKIAYYEQKMINHQIKDSVFNMRWYKLWIEG